MKDQQIGSKSIKSSLIRIAKLVVLPLIFFTLLTLVYNPQLFTGFSSVIEKNDGRLLAWTLAWDDHAILTNPMNLFQANIFYPNKNTLTYSEHMFAGSLLTLPIYIVTNGSPVESFNFLMILSYILGGFFAYVLIRYLTRNTMAGIIGGVIYGFCCYKVLNYGHLQDMVVFYFPLLLYFMFKYFEGKKLKYVIGIGFCLLMQSLSSWYHMIFIFLMFGIFALYFIHKKQFTKKDYIRFIVMGLIVITVILPFALPYFQFNKENQAAYTLTDLKTYSADLGGYLLPSPSTFIGSKILPLLKIIKARWQENFNFIGYIAIALNLVCLFNLKRIKNGIAITLNKSKAIFLICAVVFGILSLGPVLWLSDKSTRIPLPYIIIYYVLPPLRFIRVTARYSTVVFLMIAILAGFGFKMLADKIKLRSLCFLVFIILTTAIIFEYFPYKQVFSFSDVGNVPEIYYYIKNDSSIKALVELPIDVGPFITTGYIYYSGIHFKPIVNGYSGYEPKDYESYKTLFSKLPDQAAVDKLKEIGVTHILSDPDWKVDLSVNKGIKLVKVSGGYKLYEISM